MFSEEDRQIFVFHDGTRDRKVDPLALRRRLINAAGGALVSLGEAAATPEVKEGQEHIPEDPALLLGRLHAQERLLEVIRAGFNLPTFSEETGEGCTEAMCWRVWRLYNEWIMGEPSGVES